MSLVVTQAASRLGQAIAAALAALPAQTPLVLADAEPQRLNGALRRTGEARHGDLADPLSLAAAFAGAQTVLLPGAAQGANGPGLAAALEAARAAGAERVVLLSSISPEPGNPGPWAETDRTAEAMVRSAGLGWTVLRLQEGLEELIAAGRRQGPGRLFDNRESGRSAPIALADAAAAIAAVLADPAQARRTLDLTGPRLVGPAEVAEALGRAYTAHKDFKHFDQLLEEGLTRAEAETWIALGRAVRAGYYAVVSDEAARLTGRTPLDLKDAAKG